MYNLAQRTVGDKSSSLDKWIPRASTQALSSNGGRSYLEKVMESVLEHRGSNWRVCLAVVKGTVNN